MFCFKFTILSLIFKMYLTGSGEKKLNEILSQLPYVVILHYLPKRQQFLDIFFFFFCLDYEQQSLFFSLSLFLSPSSDILHNTSCLRVSCPPTHANSGGQEIKHANKVYYGKCGNGEFSS